MNDPIEAVRIAVAATPRRGRPPGEPGQVNRDIDYVCEVCGRDVGRENLFARRVVFVSLETKKPERSRTIDWVCGDCMTVHPDYSRTKYSKAPGMKGTRIAS